MGDSQRSPTLDFYGIFSKNAAIKDMCKVYKSLITKKNSDKNPSNKGESQDKFHQINEDNTAINEKKIKENPIEYEPTTPPILRDVPPSEDSCNRHKSMDESFFIRPSGLLKSLSKKRRTPSPSPTCLSRNASRSSSPARDIYRSKSTGRRRASDTAIPSVTNSTRKGNTTPIIYSQSTARKTPPPVERKLQCTLEELWHGCIKKIKINRNVIRNGIMDQEEEILMIKVEPGWKKGTKITFEGKGDERPGYHPADLILLIDEKRHPLFVREGDDLEIGLEIPLLQALTGCTVSVPLLGGEKMCLSFDDIIYPGFVKIIRGQGMPTKAEGRRGDLRIKFLVEFPFELSDEQRIEASSILQECS